LPTPIFAFFVYCAFRLFKMGKTRELSQFERGQIIGLWIGGRTHEAISRVLKFPKSTVTDTIVRYKNFNTGLTAKRTGRPCSMNNNDRRKLLKVIKKDNKLSLDEIKQKFSQDKKVSTKTIRKNLHQMQIYSRVAAPKPLLTESQREKRLSWCIERQSWSVQQWKTVIWSDESRFTLFKNDGPSRVWRKNGTRYNIENLTPTVKHGGGGVMVWGCFSGKGLGPLVKVDGKMNRLDYIEILDKHLLPFIRSKHHRQRYAFQDDNAPVHTARDVKNWIAQQKVKVLPDWPSQSPDLNPIEHLWHELERRLRKRSVRPKNFHELEGALQEEWERIPSETYINLIESMPRRIEACIKNNGWPTKY
jgi:hypothetical protein